MGPTLVSDDRQIVEVKPGGGDFRRFARAAVAVLWQ
jgi:hypothetical protein